MTGEAVLNGGLIQTYGIECVMRGNAPRTTDIAYGWIRTVAGDAFPGGIPVDHIAMASMTLGTVTGGTQ